MTGQQVVLLEQQPDISSRSWYYMEVFPDPVNDIVYVLNAPMMQSIDGGKKFHERAGWAWRHHDFVDKPKNHDNMILGTMEGGNNL